MAIVSNLLTCREVAAILEVTPGRVRQFVTGNRLPVRGKVGTNLLFDRKDVRAFAKKKRLRGRPKKTS